MKNTLTIRIKTVDKMLAGFRRSYKAIERGKKPKPQSGAYFTSIEAARNFLTPERVALLRAIRHERPGSIYELAKIAERDLKSVQTDVKVLERHGLVRLREDRSTRRKVKVPEAPYREIALKIAI
jgi:predicted transcriptional regulator